MVSTVTEGKKKKQKNFKGKVALESKVAKSGFCKISKFLVKLYLELQSREAICMPPHPVAALPPCRTPNYHMFAMAEPKGIKMDFEAAFTVHFIYI